MRDGPADGKELRREGEGAEVISDASRPRESSGRDGSHADKVQAVGGVQVG